jgi:hypothetical protein
MGKPYPNDGFFQPGPNTDYTEENPHKGAVIQGGAVGLISGCAAGAGWMAAIAAPEVPAEAFAPEVGCVLGLVSGEVGPLGVPWLDNAIEGEG